MAVTLTTPNTILGVLEPKTTTERLLSNVAMVLIGTLLITAAAKINVPTWPVPVKVYGPELGAVTRPTPGKISTRRPVSGAKSVLMGSGGGVSAIALGRGSD